MIYYNNLNKTIKFILKYIYFKFEYIYLHSEPGKKDES